MAQRLATEYVKTCLQLTEAQLSKFIAMFEDQQVTFRVQVMENGNQEVVFQDDEGLDIVFSFEQKLGYYECTGSCRLSNTKLVNLLRKAVAEFKGSAIVNRIYSAYTVVYAYENGKVVKIVEVASYGEKIIYEYQDTMGQLEQLFRSQQVEQEIVMLQDQINHLLDIRNAVNDTVVCSEVDQRLHQLTQRLFVLEA
jgi:hypothetical protein